MLFASGEIATPTSPIPPERESGVIFRKGTAVVITLLFSSWPAKTPAGGCAFAILPIRRIDMRNKNDFFIANVF